MKDICNREGANWISVSSMATSSWETGNPPDPRAIMEGKRRGITIAGRSTQLDQSHAEEIDMFLVMDKDNHRNALSILGNSYKHKVFMLGSFEDDAQDTIEIKDPYYMGGFENTFEQIARSCEGLYKYLCSSKRIV